MLQSRCLTMQLNVAIQEMVKCPLAFGASSFSHSKFCIWSGNCKTGKNTNMLSGVKIAKLEKNTNISTKCTFFPGLK